MEVVGGGGGQFGDFAICIFAPVATRLAAALTLSLEGLRGWFLAMSRPAGGQRLPKQKARTRQEAESAPRAQR